MPFYSRYNPSLMPALELESTFVQRDSIVEQFVTALSEADAGRHRLLVGSPGLGKSHTLALLYHRVRLAISGQPRKCILCHEQKWLMASYADFVVNLAHAFFADNSPASPEGLDELWDLRAPEAARAAVGMLQEGLAQQDVLLFVDDLDRLVDRLGTTDRKRLQAFFKETAGVHVVATARRVTPLEQSGLMPLFTVTELCGLEGEEAAQLMSAVARTYEDQTLPELLATPEGQGFVRAVHHLAGGMHRFYVSLAEQLLLSGFEHRDRALARALDGLAPFERSRLNDLSAQQQRIMNILCSRRRATTVKEVARLGLMSHQTASSHLKTLRDLRYVCSIRLGRASYYEVRDPILPLCTWFPRRQGATLSASLHFVTLWCTPVNLNSEVALPRPETFLAPDFLREELLKHKPGRTESSENARLSLELAEHLRGDQLQEVLPKADRLIERRGRPWDYFARIHCMMLQGRWEAARADLEDLLAKRPDNALACCCRGYVLLRLGEAAEAMPWINKAIGLEVKHYDAIWCLRAAAEYHLGRYDEALVSCQRQDQAQEARAAALLIQALAHLALGQPAKALALCPQGEEAPVEAHIVRGACLYELERPYEAVQAFERVLTADPRNALASGNRGTALWRLGARDEALDAWREAVECGVQERPVLLGHCLGLLASGDRDQGLRALEGFLERFGRPEGVAAAMAATALTTVASTTGDASDLDCLVARILEIFERTGLEEALGVGLARSLSHLIRAGAPTAFLTKWYDRWQEAVGGHPDFEVSLRLLRAVARRFEGHPQAFLELPREERALLEPWFSET